MLLSVPVDGGAVTTLASGPGLDPVSIAVDTTNVYWTDNDSLLSTPHAGGAPVTLASLGNSEGIEGMTVAAGDAFLAVHAASGAIATEPVAGGPTTTLASASYPQFVAVNTTHVFWTAGTVSGPPTQVTQLVQTTPIAGGTITTLATRTQAPQAIAADDTRVYWIESGGFAMGAGVVLSMPVAGGTVTTLATGLYSPSQTIALDAAYLYFADGTSSIVKVPVVGGAPVTLATTLPTAPVGAIAVDDTSLYWTNYDTGVTKLTPK